MSAFIMISRNKLRMLEENEIELMNCKHEQSLEADRLRKSIASFVDGLDKHQLFESIFASNSGNNVSDTDTDTETKSNDTNKSNAQV